MDYSLKSRTLKAATEILDTVSQQAVDLDFTLPDYCADIEKILKCTLTPKIYTRSLSAGQLRIDGASVVTVLYCDSNKSALRCCEQTVPFSATLPVNSEVGEHIIMATAKPQYLNCRALTPRRLTIHGAVALYASILAKTEQDIYSDGIDEELQIKHSETSVYELCEFSQEQFSVAEAVTINTKSPVESIVRSELIANVTERIPSGDKLMLKGEMTLRMLYISDAATGATEQFVYIFPFSRVVDSTKGNSDVCDLRLDVLSYELMLRSEPLSEEPVLSIEAKLCVSVLGFEPTEVSYVSDAYSTAGDTVPEYDTLSLCRCFRPFNISSTQKATLSMGDKAVQKIVDIFADETSVTAEIKDSTLNLSGRVNVCILAQSSEGELSSIERQVDINCVESVDEMIKEVSKARAYVSSISYRLCDNNEIELRLELKISATLRCAESIRQVRSINVLPDTDMHLTHPLTLYFASKGENIWDIAKHFRASMQTICDENSVSEDTLAEDKMMMIIRI